MRRPDVTQRRDASKQWPAGITYARAQRSRGWKHAWMLVFSFRERKREMRGAPAVSAVFLRHYVSITCAPRRHNRTYRREPVFRIRRGTLPADAMLSSSRKKSLPSISAGRRSHTGERKRRRVIAPSARCTILRSRSRGNTGRSSCDRISRPRSDDQTMRK